MSRYIATFHTHFSALITCRALNRAGVPADMAPVPRALSADCGTCVRFEADTPCPALMHVDFDHVVLVGEAGDYQTVVNNDAP